MKFYSIFFYHDTIDDVERNSRKHKIFVRLSVLVRHIRKGGEYVTELEQIYDRYFKDVYLFTLGLSKDEHVAEDITSETFMKAIKDIGNFKGDCDIRVWLCQIAKNAYISYLRKNKKQVSVESIPEQKDDMDVERIVFSSVEAMKVHKILHKLEEPYKEVFSLRVFGELSFKEIADVFGKTDNWACVTFHRAKKMMMKEMR